MNARRLGGADVTRRRLRNLVLTGPGVASPEEAVGRLGAVQAQDYGPAKWSVAQRTASACDADLERAIATGSILRTHVLRPTWHFVLPEDIRWLLAATAPRVLARTAPRYRSLGLDAATLARSRKLLARALRGGNELTRREIGALLAAAGVDVQGQRLPHLLSDAELHAVICSGPRHGKQHSYALLDERVPQTRDVDRDEALGMLAGRYFTSHGPASVKDFAAWASLTMADVRVAVDAAQPALVSEDFDGLTLWSDPQEPEPWRASPTGPAQAPGAATNAGEPPTVRLLQAYDEYVMGYSETRHLISGGTPLKPTPVRPNMHQTVIRDGRLAGYWTRSFRRESVAIEVALLEPLHEGQLQALLAEADRFAAFHGMIADVAVTSLPTDAASGPRE